MPAATRKLGTFCGVGGETEWGRRGGVGEDAKREEPILGFNLGFGVRVGFWLRGLSWWIGSAADSEIGLRLLGLNTC